MKPRLYRCFDENDKLLYVGISVSVLNRLSCHKKYSNWFDKVMKITLQTYDDKKQLYKAEIEAIKNEKPEFNQAYVEGLKIDRSSGLMGRLKLAEYLNVPADKIKSEIRKNTFPLLPLMGNNTIRARWVKCQIDANIQKPEIAEYLERLRSR